MNHEIRWNQAFSIGRVHPPRTMLPGSPPAAAGVCPQAQRHPPCWCARRGAETPAPPGATPQPRQRAAVRRPGRSPADTVRRRGARGTETFKQVMVLSSCTCGGTASMVVARGVRACRTWPRHGMRHMGNSRARWGDADAGGSMLVNHSPFLRRGLGCFRPQELLKGSFRA